MTRRYCPCGARLLRYEELRRSPNYHDRELARHYLDPDSAYCEEEDDVVPSCYWIRTRLGLRLRRLRHRLSRWLKPDELQF